MKKIAHLPVLSEEQRDDAALRAQDLAWSLLAGLFDQYAATQKLTYEKLGARIKRSKSHVQRWLSSPFNMSLKSLGLLAEALDAELVITLEPRSAKRTSCGHPAERGAFPALPGSDDPGEQTLHGGEAASAPADGSSLQIVMA
ncbi:MAG TPA: hypothetical protein VIA98_03105 [Allosphingosinicella sp.]|jgi:transcriptional regulator with XRE-family HTH domain